MFDFGIVFVEECFHVDGSDHYWVVFREPIEWEGGFTGELCTEWLLNNPEEEPIKFVESRGPVRQVIA